jgi:hypothetical protein
LNKLKSGWAHVYNVCKETFFKEYLVDVFLSVNIIVTILSEPIISGFSVMFFESQDLSLWLLDFNFRLDGLRGHRCRSPGCHLRMKFNRGRLSPPSLILLPFHTGLFKAGSLWW